MSGVPGAIERAMAMNDRAWRRHANPWSGWTRLLTALPLLALALWSRVWLGWAALGPQALAAGWIWLNPRIFPEPRRFDGWMSRGVLGEYVVLHYADAVAPHHRRASVVLGALSLPGLLVLAVGLWQLWWDWTLFGIVLTALPKLWFVDRMAWVWEGHRRGGGTVLGIAEDAG